MVLGVVGMSLFSRRELLRHSALGTGALALSGLTGRTLEAAGSPHRRQPHLPAKAKRVIFLFMHGGPCEVDTFDY